MGQTCKCSVFETNFRDNVGLLGFHLSSIIQALNSKFVLISAQCTYIANSPTVVSD